MNAMPDIGQCHLAVVWVASIQASVSAHAEEGGLFDELHYWAPHPANRTEVDFLLRRGGELVAIEDESQLRYHTGMRHSGPVVAVVTTEEHEGLRAIDAGTTVNIASGPDLNE